MRLFRLAVLTLSVLAMATAEAQTRRRAPAQQQQQGEQQQQSPGPKKEEKRFPVPSSWVALSLNGKPYDGADRPTFSLDQQYRAKGFGGCNTYSATAYPLREQGLAVGPFALTKKSCDKAAMSAEQAFLVALRTSAKWDITGSTLIIRTGNGELRFERSL